MFYQTKIKRFYLSYFLTLLWDSKGFGARRQFNIQYMELVCLKIKCVFFSYALIEL